MARNKQRKNGRNGRASSNSRNGKSKEFEVNLKDSSVNPVDLRVLTAKGKKNNDIAWYNKLKQLFDDATSLPFNMNNGLPYTPFKAALESDMSIWSPAYTAPGIMRIWVAPVLGKAVSNNDPINLAAQNLYVRVTSKNNRDGKYDRTDLMMMIYAADSAFMLYEFLNRLYCGFKNISDENRYYPLPLLSTMFADVENLQESLDQLRSLLNTFAYRLASINIPDVFSFISRHSWLYSHVYKDANTEKAQTYMYMPAYFYVWTEGKGEGPNSLQPISFNTLFNVGTGTGQVAKFGIDQIRNAINTLIVPLIGSSYIGLMSSDIAMAFSDSEMVKISEITDQASLEPQYDELVLMQMSNSTVINHVNESSLQIVQKMSDLVSGPYLYQLVTAESNIDNSHVRYLKKYLNLRGVADNDAVAEATRLMATGEVFTPGTLQITASGTEIVTQIDLCRFAFSQGIFAEPSMLTLSYNQSIMNYVGTESANLPSIVSRLQNNLMQQVSASAFDWSPTMYIWTYDLDSDESEFFGVIQDLDNYVYVSDMQLELLHNAIVLSEFKVD